MQKLLTDPDIRKKIERLGYQPITDVSLDTFKQRLVREVSAFKKIAVEANIQSE